MSYVYMIRSGECVKIGKSDDPRKRLDQMQTGNPQELKLIGFWESEDACKDEQRLHEIFAEGKERGEWFRVSSACTRGFVMCARFFSFAYTVYLIRDAGPRVLSLLDLVNQMIDQANESHVESYHDEGDHNEYS